MRMDVGPAEERKSLNREAVKLDLRASRDSNRSAVKDDLRHGQLSSRGLPMAEERSNESDEDEDPFGKMLANSQSQIDPEKEQDDEIAKLQKEVADVVRQKIAHFER